MGEALRKNGEYTSVIGGRFRKGSTHAVGQAQIYVWDKIN